MNDSSTTLAYMSVDRMVVCLYCIRVTLSLGVNEAVIAAG